MTAPTPTDHRRVPSAARSGKAHAVSFHTAPRQGPSD
eukprot:CAMPEP_0185555546 /NCGR_PEP_ID=MMETSP1381-20130426/44826_1 /TAXON_ID=298111 /ORGANISM="Pavlova sp., Strain CCMP459" /LENGTH=36 /DNA_ID= /DNA_START= /DNA_END= /DNA_ORIENTATION=